MVRHNQTHQKEQKSQDSDIQQSANTDGSLKDEARRLLAELLGTFALTLVAAGGEVIAVISGGEVSPAARAVAPGLLVMAMIYTLGSQSGAHFNPAVTLAFTLRQDFPWRRVPGYWGAQIVGAVLAALLLRVLFGLVGHLGATFPRHGTSEALVMEVVLTFLLVTAILGTATNHRLTGPNAAIAVGGTVALLALFAGPVSGASMNPARSLGPFLVSGQLADAWIYVVGPFAGALLAVLVAWLLRGRTTQEAVETAKGD
ncbi:MAG TPA: aquaporin [Ktedonobacteraceae bacterium]